MNLKFIKTDKVTFIFIWEILLLFLLSLIYVLIITKSYAYSGYILDFNLKRLLIFFPVCLIITIFGSNLKSNFGTTVWHIILILQFYPKIIYIVFSNGNLNILFGNLILLISLYFSTYISISNIRSSHLNIEDKTRNFYVLIGISVLFLLPFIRYIPYIDLSNLFLKNIYQTRALFRTLEHTPFIGYLISPLSRVLLPSLLVVAIERKKSGSILIIIFLLAFLFLVSGALKSIFFGVFSVALFYYGKTYFDKLKIFFSIFTFILLLGLIEFYVFQSTLLTNLPVRRLMFTPSFLENYYFDFFKDNHLYYSYSFLKGIVDYKLPEPVSMYVGEYLIGEPGLNANVGIIAEGFVSLGWYGVIIHSFIFSLIIIFIKSLNIDQKYFGIFFIYVFYMNNAFISTLLLTHGLLFLILYSFLCLKRDKFAVISAI